MEQEAIENILELPCRVEVRQLNASNINDYEVFENNRNIRKGQLKSLRKAMCMPNIRHPTTPFVLNIREEKQRIIDGQHRHIIFDDFLRRYPERSIEVIFCIYEGLSNEEERQVYRIWNIGAKQNTTDFINCYKDEIPYLELFCMSTNSSIYGSTHKQKVKQIADAWFSSEKMKQGTMCGYFETDLVAYIDKMIALSKEDVLEISAIYSIIKKAFYTSKIKISGQEHFKTSPLIALFCITRFLRERYNDKEIVNFLKKIPFSDVQEINQGGAKGCRIAYRRLKASLIEEAGIPEEYLPSNSKKNEE